jgi:DNA-binding NtrC family response regulator/tetratricopeptide (TPR) repeat protein
MTPPLLVDRFIANGAAWIDLAMGEAVRIRVVSFGDRGAQIAWADACAIHARLRHPVLNPLVDFGGLDGARGFEAYAALPPMRVTPAGAQRLLTHAAQFLIAHSVKLTAEQTAFAHRGLLGGPALRGKPLGIVLQERRAHGAIDEVLEAAGPGGVVAISVSGPPLSGMRTLRWQVARAARLRGYATVSPGVLSLPRLAALLAQRHVCVFADDDERERYRLELTKLLTALGRVSTRRHVTILFTRAALSGPGVIRLQSMGVPAMASMVFGDGGEPSPRDLFDAVRKAEGKPGQLLDRLGAHAFAPHVPRALVAHETSPPYEVEPASSPAPRAQAARPRGGVLARAAIRAQALAAHGRHAAAARLLSRAARVLAARGEAVEAARCAARLGDLHLSRGHAAAAIEAFELARASGDDAAVLRAAALGLATAWTDDGRLVEAEALLRSLAAAAALEQRADPGVAHSLARCLFWQARYGEAVATVHPHVDGVPHARCLTIASRIQLAEGSVVAALQYARRAAELAGDPDNAEASGDTQRALAAALAAAGDPAGAREHVRRALDAARRQRRPVDLIRTRVLQLDTLVNASVAAPVLRRLADRLLALARRLELPRLLRYELWKTVQDAVGIPMDTSSRSIEQLGVRWPGTRSHARGVPRLTELEMLMEACHAAADDQEALDRLCATALDRLRAAAVVVVCARERRVRGHSGKAWDGQSRALERALAGGAAGGPVEPIHECPLEAAEAVRFGGEVIGAVAGRWIAGSLVCPERAAATIKAAALAAAAPLRAVLDSAAPGVPDPAWPDLLGSTPEATALRDTVARAARAPYPVLIEGESGSGKELVARAVHRLGPRRDRRFCAVNCAALTDDLLEAELFGHTRGAFTGALTERSGLFEDADGGTLFLDEIGELSPRAQAKLLRVIQEGEVRRVGESFARKVDVRIVAATNRRLEDEAAAGRFRTDLRFRIDVIRITVPPLRERAADIPLLAAHFWNDAAPRVGSRATLSPEALTALARHDWPGNVRELQNVIAWLAVHSPRRGRIGAAALPRAIAGLAADKPVTFERAREEFERRLIRGALARANGHRARAAASLGVTRQGRTKMMRRLRIDDRPAV